jgi:hypothetical protein
VVLKVDDANGHTGQSPAVNIYPLFAARTALRLPANSYPLFTSVGQAARRVQEDGFLVEIVTVAGQPFQIEASTNLQDWVTVTNIAGTGETIRYLDKSSTNHTLRFYRAREMNP